MEVVCKKSNYQEEAVIVALELLSQRGWSEAKIGDHVFEYHQTKVEEAPYRRKPSFSRGHSPDMDTLDAPTSDTPKVSKYVQIAILVFAAIYSIGCLTQVIFYFTTAYDRSYQYWDLSLKLSMIFSIVLPLGFYWFRIYRKMGWMVLSAFFLYRSIANVTSFVYSIEFIAELMVNFHPLQVLFYIVMIIFPLVATYLIFMRRLRDQYQVLAKDFAIVVTIAVVINLIDFVSGYL